jgi:hypothetical protein
MARSLGGPGEAWAKEAGGAQLEEKTPKEKASKAEQKYSICIITSGTGKIKS